MTASRLCPERCLRHRRMDGLRGLVIRAPPYLLLQNCAHEVCSWCGTKRAEPPGNSTHQAPCQFFVANGDCAPDAGAISKRRFVWQARRGPNVNVMELTAEFDQWPNLPNLTWTLGLANGQRAVAHEQSAEDGGLGPPSTPTVAPSMIMPSTMVLSCRRLNAEPQGPLMVMSTSSVLPFCPVPLTNVTAWLGLGSLPEAGRMHVRSTPRIETRAS